MELVITPEPDPREREAIAAALEKLAVGAEQPAAYLSVWRRLGIAENLEREDGPE